MLTRENSLQKLLALFKTYVWKIFRLVQNRDTMYDFACISSLNKPVHRGVRPYELNEQCRECQ